MLIKQFEDKALAHYSYAIVSEDKMAVVDPARNPEPYYNLAEEHNAKIVAVFETHPHADFVSSHLQIHQETSATIYASKLVGADYPHKSFDEGDHFTMNQINFRAIHTPGHSPDGITIIAADGEEQAMFSGDTLFIGDVGRPDLREKAGNLKAKRQELAEMMYETITTKFNDLSDDVLIYPAHGAGSLCGKNMSDAASSTLGNERTGNWAFQAKSKEEFVEEILKGQPFIPHYFGHDVEINKTGAKTFKTAVANIDVKLNIEEFDADALVVDTRDQESFSNNHLPNSINIMARSESDKIETWLGAIVKPNEEFYLVVDHYNSIEDLSARIAKIGYESQIKAILTLGNTQFEKDTQQLDYSNFKNNPDQYTIIDIRNENEFTDQKFFNQAENHPLNELRETTQNIDTSKPIVVHCAGGYRSAAGSSIVKNNLENAEVYDLSDRIEDFKS
ncbi:Glyoxylase, beta-lactamase superfamily II [Psychroflexus salarius]|uniref:Glyoxylase, beta-lactamase superfamily II n=1 Tax=Psychroflexus salarius TaxID=1155689 RepID=A0A1M4SS50_9FLAO|nr:MBL fold metallo-hydrolase [Psychroflexus salarius]SHE35019.1 Glyoxylase, beta-lactamase superfamily II [Psychroflexus salarius]